MFLGKAPQGNLNWGNFKCYFKKIIKSLNFKYAFGQHSGVMDETKDFYEFPRFPINEKYGDLKRFEFLINQKEFKGYLVAVSGGADSLALAYLSKCYQIKNRNKNFHYVHVDHKLRDTSSNEAQTLKKVLKILKR